MKRRTFVQSCGVAIAASGMYSFAESVWDESNDDAFQPLWIPPLLENPTQQHYLFPTLFVMDSEHEFIPGKKSTCVSLSTFFHPCSFLAPTIKVKKGDTVGFRIHNLREEAVTNHWHGLHIPGVYDGGPHQLIEPGQRWAIDMPIRQEASVNWYHAHTCEKTARQVYEGHVGMFIIEDNNSTTLGLPDIYGFNDIPLILKDTLLDKDGQQYYALRDQPAFFGEHLAVNGTINPIHRVPSGWIRFRILNASNARFYELHFKDDRPFYVIASDGGLLNAPVKTKRFLINSGERFEIMIYFEPKPGEIADLIAFTPNPSHGDPAVGDFQLIRFVTDLIHSPIGILPNTLRREPIHWEEAVKTAPPITKTFEMSMNSNRTKMMINSKQYNMMRIDEAIPLEQEQVWKIISKAGPHPFHIHGCSFLILSINGEPPEAIYRGWKDIVFPVGYEKFPSSKELTLVIRMRFPFTTDRDLENISHDPEVAKDINHHIPYMYHCHILEHEDRGMMGQFSVFCSLAE